MKISELKPCDVCGGKIAPIFYRVTVEQMMINAQVVNQVVGLATMFGGALGIAEIFAPSDDAAVKLQENTVTLCGDCAYTISLIRVLFGKDEGTHEATNRSH